MPTEMSPIAVFAYRRTEHLSRALDALEQCPEFAASPVFVFSDGPRNADAAAEVATVRALLNARRRANMTIVEAPENRGLAASIVAGVTRLCDDYGRAIVIEDDLVVAPQALAWFNAALDRYAAEEKVWQVAAFQFDVPAFRGRDEGVFLSVTNSWGWATWKRAWDRYDPLATGWESLRRDAALSRRFDLNGSYPYTRMLIRQMEGRLDSWAIRFWWTVFRAGGIALFPPRSLVTNIGYDATATHTRPGLMRRTARPQPLVVARDYGLPTAICARPDDDAAVARAIRLQQSPLRRAAYRVLDLKRSLTFG